MTDKKPKTGKREMTRLIVLWILLLPFVVFREDIEAVLAVLLVLTSLTIAWFSWQYFPDHWYWITIPSVALLVIIFWPLLKLADRIESRLDRRV
ncbi:MAG: hypothetical protein AB8C95_12750 [Phycisphaeraceae bacterium]